MDFLIEGANEFAIGDCVYEDEPIQNLDDFLLYLPLISPDSMAMFIEQTSDVHDCEQEHRNYWLSFLYKMIPETDAKLYADRVKFFFLTEPNVWSITDEDLLDPDVRQKFEDYERYKSSDNFEREFHAYIDAQMACSKRLTHFATLNRVMKRKKYASNNT